MWAFRILAALALLLVAAPPAQAAWMEASSAHFLIYGDLPPDRMKAFAERLERFDQAIRRIVKAGNDAPSAANRVTIYMAGGVDAVQRLCRCGGGVLGFYSPRASGPVAFTVTRVAGADKFDINADIVLLHEYAHHLMMTASSGMPGWLNEGLAEFASTAKLEADGTVLIGGPAAHRAYGLMAMAQMPAATLLTSDRRKLTPEEREQVYSRGWLLTHYLVFSAERTRQLDAYLGARAKGKPELEAAKAAFGDLNSLDAELEKYKRQKTLSAVRISAASLHVGAVALRELRPGEAALMPYRMRSERGVDAKTAKPLRNEAVKRAAAFPDDPWVQGALAEMEYDAGEDDAADAAADRALARDPKSLQALLYKGRIALRRAAKDKAAKPETWQAARGWLVKANRLEPDAAEPLMLYYDSFVLAKQPPSASAKRGLERAAELVPQDPGLRLRLALLYLHDAMLPEARAALATLAYAPHAAADNPASKLIAMIDEGKEASQIAAEADKLSGAAESAP